MKKETFLAIILGVVFGFIFALLILGKIFQNHLSEKTKSSLPPIKKPSVLPQKTISLISLNILKPKNFLVVEDEEITIEGEAETDSLIVIQSPIKDLVFQNKKEKFKINFPLGVGENVIKIVVYPKNKNLRTQEKTLYIYYLPKEI